MLKIKKNENQTENIKRKERNSLNYTPFLF